MSLYDGLDIDEKPGGGRDSKPDISGWSSGFKMLHSQVQAKKKALLNTKSRRGNTLAPVVDLKRQTQEDGPLHFNQMTGKLERLPSGTVVSMSMSPFIANDPLPDTLLGVPDEYNPLRPNDYEDVVKRRREQRRKERREQERERDRKDEERRRKRRQDEDEDRRRRRDTDSPNYNRRRRDDGDELPGFSRRRRDDDEESYDRPRRGNRGGAAIAPPTALIEDIKPMPDPDEEDRFSPTNSPPRQLPGASMGLAGSVASKIMAKYGYKEGAGLGKKEQGMSTALQVEKTSKRGGKIIHEKDIPKFEPPKPIATGADLLRNPSKVILLKNMVGPGDVDEDLEPETAEECGKYGKVNKCVIFEMSDVIEEEAVRIFVEFERMEEAIKAVVDLNGRFFGGRIVTAGFYNLDRFRRLDLGDD